MVKTKSCGIQPTHISIPVCAKSHHPLICSSFLLCCYPNKEPIKMIGKKNYTYLTKDQPYQHRTLNIERRSEEKRSLVEAVRRMGRPFRAWESVGDGTQGAALGCRMMPRWGVGKERGKPLNKERRYPIALTMMGPWGCGMPQFTGFPWASADGFRRSLGRMPCWGGRIERRLNP
jgi:hypothetical protein